ncbi:MAG: hypothetical protein CMI06_09950 [Oceanospirillaceae bacterium]|nr:hypothetical protein [Oceanospirillaceae bacterium]
MVPLWIGSVVRNGYWSAECNENVTGLQRNDRSLFGLNNVFGIQHRFSDQQSLPLRGAAIKNPA